MIYSHNILDGSILDINDSQAKRMHLDQSLDFDAHFILLAFPDLQIQIRLQK